MDAVILHARPADCSAHRRIVAASMPNGPRASVPMRAHPGRTAPPLELGQWSPHWLSGQNAHSDGDGNADLQKIFRSQCWPGLRKQADTPVDKFRRFYVSAPFPCHINFEIVVKSCIHDIARYCNHCTISIDAALTLRNINSAHPCSPRGATKPIQGQLVASCSSVRPLSPRRRRRVCSGRRCAGRRSRRKTM